VTDFFSWFWALVLIAGTFYGWRAGRRLLSAESLPPVPVSRETSGEALRRAVRARRAAEHDLWLAEFRALCGGCPDCGGPVHRSSRRAATF
jgi:hypothetical protein